MIKVPTLLVLGAGAAMPYGFPSGAQLRELIIAKTRFDDVFSQLNFTQIEVKGFTTAFRQSELYSIDEFLAIPIMNQQYAEIGKAAIARTIMEFEQEARLAGPVKGMGHWYRYLWNSMERHDVEANQLRVVTFNYDRSLEFYLARAYAAISGSNIDAAIERLAHFRIKHVYGQVGQLTGRTTSTTRAFEPDVNAGTVKVAAAGIRVMREREQNNEVLAQIREDIRWADRICFLGFGYDPLNISRLSVDLIGQRHDPNRYGSPDLYGTTCGLLGLEANMAMNLVRCTSENRVNFLDADNETLLRSRIVLIG